MPAAPPPAPAATNLLCVFIDLLILGLSCKWNHTTCGHLCLAAFIRHVCKVHPCCSTCQFSIPFSCQIILIIWIYHSFKIPLSINWWAYSCFHFWAIRNNAAMNIPVQVFMCIYIFFLWGVYLGVGLLDPMVTLCLTFWETARLFSKIVTSGSSSRGSVVNESD